MRIPILAAIILAAAAVGATAGLLPRPVPLYDHTPARTFSVLGPVAIASDALPEGRNWSTHHAPALIADARTRYTRRPDALVEIRHEPLPGGSGVRSSAIAVVWNR
jgi:hypothetical protein